MILPPTHSRVIMPAAITDRDSTARYRAMRGPTAAWRAMAPANVGFGADSGPKSDIATLPKSATSGLMDGSILAHSQSGIFHH